MQKKGLLEPDREGYCGSILTGDYSPRLKKRITECVEGFVALERTGILAIPYLAAWHRHKRGTIWYEYVGGRLSKLLGCGKSAAARTLRRKILEQRIYDPPAATGNNTPERLDREALRSSRAGLRLAADKSGTFEAVYKILAKDDTVAWLKDQAVVETHVADDICLSIGHLTSITKEMGAESEAEARALHFKKIITEQTSKLTQLALELRQETTARQRTEGRLEHRLDEIFQAIINIVETRDPYTAGHQRRTAHLASAIAVEMGLGENEKKGLWMAGLIHDIGKIAVPAEILSKPGRLDDAEFELIKRHPRVAYDILRGIDLPWPVDQIVLQHHEAINGSGYPQGLMGFETLIESRILSVADSVETISSHRPYRPGLGLQTALDEITAQKGILYDSKVVDACVRLFETSRYHLISESEPQTAH